MHCEKKLRVPLIIRFTLSSGKKKQHLTFIERFENTIFRVPLKFYEIIFSQMRLYPVTENTMNGQKKFSILDLCKTKYCLNSYITINDNYFNLYAIFIFKPIYYML